MAAKKQVGIGLIGCGGRLRGLVQGMFEKLPASKTKKMKIVGIYDPHPESVKETLDNIAPDAIVYDSYKELLENPDIDWVMIGSWNCFHREHTVAAFKAGKHVFCEKPLATNLKDCLAMKKAQDESGRMFNIGFTLRYSPHYRKIQKLLCDGEIGDIISMEFNETLHFNHGGYIHGDWRRKTEWAGTHLLEKCSHDIDLANWMVGSVASRVASFGGCDFFLPKNKKYQKKLGPCPESGMPAFQTWPGVAGNTVNPFNTDKDIIDNQVAVIEYANGVRATFHTNCMSGIPERRMYICGTEGTIRADVITGSIEICKIGWKDKIKDVSTKGKGGHGGGDMVLLNEVTDSMLKGKPPFSTLEDGFKSAITCFGIDKAMNTGRAVNMESMWKKAGVKMK